MLFIAAGSAAELPGNPAGRENVLGLRRRKRGATHGITGQGARSYLLFFTTRSRGELWPGAETNAARHTVPAADNPSHPAVDASATDVSSHAFTLPDTETVTALRE